MVFVADFGKVRTGYFRPVGSGVTEGEDRVATNPAKQLTVTRVNSPNLEPGWYPDRGGLVLKVNKTSRQCVFRGTVKGRGRVTLGLGSVRSVGLAEAREIARQYRDWAKAGIDPRAHLH